MLTLEYMAGHGNSFIASHLSTDIGCHYFEISVFETANAAFALL